MEKLATTRSGCAAPAANGARGARLKAVRRDRRRIALS
jgi:hypothetical protein